MQRSSSMTRVADEYYKNQLSSSSPATGTDGNSGNNLPVYTPSSRKDKYRLRSPENAVHLIPFVLLLCALILWFFSSNPVQEQGSNKINFAGLGPLQLSVDVVNKNHGGIVGNLKELKGATSTDVDGTFMPHIEIDDVDILHHHIHHHRQAIEIEPSV